MQRTEPAHGGREAKTASARIALGKPIQCLAGKRSYDRAVASCTVGEASVADIMRPVLLRVAVVGDSARVADIVSGVLPNRSSNFTNDPEMVADQRADSAHERELLSLHRF